MLSLSIVSPFVTPIRGFNSTHEFFRQILARMPDVSISLVTSPPSDTQNNVLSWQEADLIDALGVQLIIRSSPTLHSKIYYIRYREGDTSCFLGSANFTRGGFEGNDETVALWRRSSDDPQVEREMARLQGPGSFTLIQWKVKTKKHSQTLEEDDGD